MSHFEQGFGTKIKFAGHIRRRLRMDFIEKIKNSRAATCSREQCDALPTQNNQNYRMVSTVFFFFFFTNPLSIFEEIILCIYII